MAFTTGDAQADAAINDLVGEVLGLAVATRMEEPGAKDEWLAQLIQVLGKKQLEEHDGHLFAVDQLTFLWVGRPLAVLRVWRQLDGALNAVMAQC